MADEPKAKQAKAPKPEAAGAQPKDGKEAAAKAKPAPKKEAEGKAPAKAKAEGKAEAEPKPKKVKRPKVRKPNLGPAHERWAAMVNARVKAASPASKTGKTVKVTQI